MPDETTDVAVLADPSAHTVDEVTAVLARSSPEQVSAAKAAEREGKSRRGILEYELPRPATEEPPSTDEEFDVAGWRERAGWFQVDDARVSPHAIVGALADREVGATFTQAQVQRALEKFLKR